MDHGPAGSMFLSSLTASGATHDQAVLKTRCPGMLGRCRPHLDRAHRVDGVCATSFVGPVSCRPVLRHLVHGAGPDLHLHGDAMRICMRSLVTRQR